MAMSTLTSLVQTFFGLLLDGLGGTGAADVAGSADVDGAAAALAAGRASQGTKISAASTSTPIAMEIAVGEMWRCPPGRPASPIAATFDGRSPCASCRHSNGVAQHADPAD